MTGNFLGKSKEFPAGWFPWSEIRGGTQGGKQGDRNFILNAGDQGLLVHGDLYCMSEASFSKRLMVQPYL